MKLHAYVLAADPEFVTASVESYYELVDRIVVSYDAGGRGWSGARVPVEECVARLRALDRDRKLVELSGAYARPGGDLMAADTAQRRDALAAAGDGADWVLQLDADEVLPDADALLRALGTAEELGLPAVEWPMRVLFRSLGGDRFLEVCTRDRRDRYDYPGPVAVRPDVRLVDARRTDGPFLRAVVRGDDRSLQLARPPAPGERRAELLDATQAIVHYSWAGSPARIRAKVAAWGHSDGWRTRAFYALRWRPAPLLWRAMHDVHPFARGLWPALRVTEL